MKHWKKCPTTKVISHQKNVFFTVQNKSRCEVCDIFQYSFTSRSLTFVPHPAWLFQCLRLSPMRPGMGLRTWPPWSPTRLCPWSEKVTPNMHLSWHVVNTSSSVYMLDKKKHGHGPPTCAGFGRCLAFSTILDRLERCQQGGWAR